MTNTEIINEYIEAFNNKDVERCFKFLADDLTVLKLPNEEMHLKDKKQAKEHYLSSIEDGSFLPIKVINEMSLGQYVTYLIEKADASTSRKAIVTNYVVDGLIKKMWIAPG